MTHTRTIRIAAVTIAASALTLTGTAAALASGTAAARPAAVSTQAAAKAVTITIKNYGFKVSATAKPGAKVTVHNQDSVTHTVTSNTAGKFNVRIPAHATRAFTAPKKAGTYSFHCAIHSEMHGVLHVAK